jgi:hypothetical protein
MGLASKERIKTGNKPHTPLGPLPNKNKTKQLSFAARPPFPRYRALAGWASGTISAVKDGGSLELAQ